VTEWPEARTVRLRKLFREGYTDRELAFILGVTVAAIRNKRWRIRLPREGGRYSRMIRIASCAR
jgi:hypothetical protein